MERPKSHFLILSPNDSLQPHCRQCETHPYFVLKPGAPSTDSALTLIWRLDKPAHPLYRINGPLFTPEDVNKERHLLIKRSALPEDFAKLMREVTGLPLPDLESDANDLIFSVHSYYTDVGEIIFRDIVRSGKDSAEISQRCDAARRWCLLPKWVDDFVSHKDGSYVTFMELDFQREQMLADAMFDGIVMAPVRRYRETIGKKD